MKSSTIIVLVILAAVVGGGGYYLFQQSSPKNDAMMQKESGMMDGKDASVVKQDGEAMMVKGDRYIEYTPSVLENTAGNRRVLFFYASWCPTCGPADANFKENVSQIPTDTTVIRVNYNDPETDAEEKALAQKYGITYQHTYVQIDGQGNEVAKWNGGQIDELLTNIK